MRPILAAYCRSTTVSEQRIAILTPSKDSYSETFIKNHIERLPFDSVVFYGGYLPWKTAHDPERSREIVFWNLYDIFTRKKNLKVSTYKRRRFAALLKKHKIKLVFAEFIITGSYVWEVCKDLGIPLIATGLGYELSVRSVLEKNELAYKGYLSYASCSILVAQNMKDTLADMGGDRNKMIWSPAGPADDFFTLKANHSSKNFLAIGRFMDKKAPHLSVLAFAEVLKKHPDARLKMAGDGPLLTVCQDIVKALDMESSVDFLGRIDQNEQRRLLSDCRAFIQHSRVAPDGDMEGTPVAILEASAAGVPVISTHHSGIPDVLSHGRTGYLVAEGDTADMAVKMLALLDDEPLAKKMGEEGRRTVSENFTLEKHIDTITKAINAAISER